jgi:hypothetical protein
VSQLPPQNPAPPTIPPPTSQVPPARPGGLDDYQRIAETVGGPSLRLSDNVLQALIVLASSLLGAGVGWLVGGSLAGASMGPRIGAIVFGIGAMIASTLISGLVLMVLGWVRASKSKRR